MCPPVKTKTFAFRARPDLKERLERLATALDRDYTWLIEKCIEGHLPAMEEKYAKEISELGHYPTHSREIVRLEDKKPASSTPGRDFARRAVRKVIEQQKSKTSGPGAQPP